MKYDYYENIMNGIEEYIQDEINIDDYESAEELEEYLNDVLWAEDRITGNASGSYTFSRYEAEENLCHNFALLEEACDEFGISLGKSI